MEKLSLILLSSFLALHAFAAKEKNIIIDPTSSSLTWNGKKLGGEHTGEVKLKDGAVTLAGNQIISGVFHIDMTSITDKDLTDATYNAKLIGHLKSDDFFFVEKYPTAIFQITNIVATARENGATHNITGNLTIKGITHPITFPATIKADAKSFEATAVIVIDRTKYNIKYRSKNFFKELGDRVIEDNFTLTLKLVKK